MIFFKKMSSSLLRFVFGASLISTAFAALKSKGIEPRTELVSHELLQKSLDSYLTWGEYIVDSCASMAQKYPEWFRITKK